MKLRGGRAEDSDMAVAPLHPVGIDELDDEFDEAFRRAAGPGKFAQGDTSRGADAQTGQLVRSPEEVIEEAEKYVEQNDLDGAELVSMTRCLLSVTDAEGVRGLPGSQWGGPGGDGELCLVLVEHAQGRQLRPGSIRGDDAVSWDFEQGQEKAGYYDLLRYVPQGCDMTSLIRSHALVDDVTPLILRLLVHRQDGCKDFQGAMKLYEELLQIHPREASLYFSMALMHHGAAGQEHLYTEDERLELEDLKNVTKAVELYRTAIELEPTMVSRCAYLSVEALNNLATVLLQESINFTESEVFVESSLVLAQSCLRPGPARAKSEDRSQPDGHAHRVCEAGLLSSQVGARD
eukprot:750912-Hanusia_phi.AAC.1